MRRLVGLLQGLPFLSPFWILNSKSKFSEWNAEQWWHSHAMKSYHRYFNRNCRAFPFRFETSNIFLSSHPHIRTRVCHLGPGIEILIIPALLLRWKIIYQWENCDVKWPNLSYILHQDTLAGVSLGVGEWDQSFVCISRLIDWNGFPEKRNLSLLSYRKLTS